MRLGVAAPSGTGVDLAGYVRFVDAASATTGVGRLVVRDDIAGHLTPHAWAVDAFVNLVGKGAGISGIASEIGVLALFAAVLVPLGAWRLRRAITG